MRCRCRPWGVCLAFQNVYPPDHLEHESLDQANHSLAAPAENTLFDHRVGRGSGELEMTGLAPSGVPVTT